MAIEVRGKELLWIWNWLSWGIPEGKWMANSCEAERLRADYHSDRSDGDGFFQLLYIRKSISPSFLKDFAGYRILCWQLFFQYFKDVPLSSHLPCFDEKYALILIFVLLYISWLDFFFVAAFKVFFLSLILSNLIILCLGTVFFIQLVLGVAWVSWTCGYIVF